jgi:uncharacterized protein YheU (UPF0270 family)
MNNEEYFNQDAERAEPPVSVPHRELAPDTLRAVIESFVLREGTDYGLQELSLEQKVSRLMLQLDRGEAEILFDPNTHSVTFVPVQRGKGRAPVS